MRGQLSPEGLVDLVTRTRPDLCPTRVKLDGSTGHDFTAAACRWIAEEVGVDPNTVSGWVRRGALFPIDRQEDCIAACARWALTHRSPVERCAEMEGRRILVIEDDAFIALDLERILHEQGCAHPVLCLDYDEGKAATERDGWDAALVDLNLRGRLAWPLVADLVKCRVPTILMTAYDSRTVSAPQTLIPEPARLLKPFDPDRLIGLLAALLTPEPSVP